jgi:two-component system OmpR family sensor kinase
VTEQRVASRPLRRLRWRLTILYAGVSALGLIILAVLAARTDQQQRDTQLHDEMRLRANTAVALLYYEDDKLQLDGLVDDDVTIGSPYLVVLEGDRTVFTTHDASPTMPADDLKSLAKDAMEEDDLVWTEAEATNGRTMRLVASPFIHDDTEQTVGAVIAVGDPRTGAAQHNALVTALIVGCTVLIALIAAAGHLLSGRSMRPAFAALDQQETFLADAAHDLRTPVATLRTLAETAVADRSQAPDLLPRVAGLAVRMSGIIDDLLTRARLNAGVGHLQREPLRLDQLVQSVVDGIDTHGHEVSVAAHPCTVRADAHLVTRAVANLVENAVRHGHRPGEPARVEVTVHGTGRVTVADSGPGVDESVATALFERFRGRPGSVGLGLSIARWAADLHGGTLTVAANPGGGAVFELSLTAQAGAQPGNEDGAAARRDVLDPADEKDGDDDTEPHQRQRGDGGAHRAAEGETSD